MESLSKLAWFFNGFTVLLLIAAAVGLVNFIKGAWEAYTTGKTRHIQRQTPGSTRTLYIGPLGIWQSDTFIPLNGPNLKLGSVYVDSSDPPLLQFGMWRGRNIPVGISIPIPKGQEASAQELVERFKQEIL